MTIADWCLRNRATTGVAAALLILGGVLSFQNLPKAENPDFVIRTALVITQYPGATSAKVEALVTNPLEEKLRELPHLNLVKTQSMAGVSIIAVELLEATPADAVGATWNKLRDKVEAAAPHLPDGAWPPAVNDEVGDVFGMVVALTGDDFSFRERNETAQALRDELLKVEGVAKVELYGVQDERIFIDFSDNLFAERNLSPFQIAQAFDRENTVAPSGEARVGDERVLIRSSGEFQTLDDIANVTFRRPGSTEAIALRDIARVSRGAVDPPRALARFNQHDAIILAINMAPGHDVMRVGARLETRLAELEADLSLGYQLDTVTWEPRFVGRKISDFMINLIEAFGFVFIVMLITTGLRTGLIASALIPLAILMCFALMPSFGIALHQISIASLIIALGIMVDNGVVVSESMLVRLARGEDRRAAMNGAVRELWKPLLAASATTIWAFLPIATSQSNVGEFCLALFQVITITLLCSWLISLTIVPLLCFRFLKVSPKKQTYDGPVYRTYRALLLFGVRRRWVFLGLCVALTVAGAIGFGSVKKLFFPPNEREVILVDVWTPYGSDVRTTAAAAGVFEDWLLAQDGVAQVTTFAGNGGPRWNLSQHVEQSNPSYAFMLVEVAGGPAGVGLVPKLAAHAQRHADAELPQARFTVKRLEQGPPVGAPIQIRVSGDDITTLYALRDEVATLIESVPGTLAPTDDWGEWRKQLAIDINQNALKLADLTSEDVALSLQLQFSGLRVSDFREGDQQIPIVLRASDRARENLDRIESLRLYSMVTPRNVPLAQVARTELDFVPSNIRRRDGKRTMTIQAYLAPGTFSNEVLATMAPGIAQLADESRFAGYTIEVGGESEKSAAAQASIAAGFPLAMALLFLTLVAMFNSVVRPIIILITIVPALFGITAGLLLTGASFGFMAMLGALSLMGIIVNNAIMMIDTTETLRERGIDDANAIVVGGLSRLRPILTTAATTVIGLLPLWLFGGEMWRPMAIVIIFGLLFATVLTLVLCPVLYALFFRVSFRPYRWNPAILTNAAD
ncbi:efflux RND transporter permease subunit [Synoicihabitans lomoniglobus]|uniref:Efflux RND transporter permease subunit n=1 Tax=Synoicihabitans lomoniglobus TaxID=2909285 RepID=A0AAF0CSI2_9BACT|nr:efflux RND transporter permease subunit [Opitutaceae bacterium LMO-M01]WED67240.1 efflux RND transporter permease subunit [Opitutaceae bacterium LMO-M01]